MSENIFDFVLCVGNIYRIDTEKHDLPLFGRLVRYDDRFLQMEKRNGKLVTVNVDSILSLEEMPEPDDDAEAL